MTLLKDLLALRDERVVVEDEEQITEARQESLRDLVDRWMDATKTYNFEGERGIRNFEKFVRVLGYRDIDGFLADNSGALEAMMNWIQKSNVPEFKEKILDQIGPLEDDDDDSDD